MVMVLKSPLAAALALWAVRIVSAARSRNIQSQIVAESLNQQVVVEGGVAASADAGRANRSSNQIVVDFDYDMIIQEMAGDSDPINGFLTQGFGFAKQILSGEATVDSVASSMLDKVGTAWVTIGTMYNPLLGTAISMLFGFARGALNPSSPEVSLVDEILQKCDKMFTKKMFQNEIREAQTFLMDKGRNLKFAGLNTQAWIRMSMQDSISIVFNRECVHEADTVKDECVKWRRSGAALLSEILFASMYQSLSVSMLDAQVEGAYDQSVRNRMNDHMDMLSKHFVEYSAWSVKDSNYDKGVLVDVTTGVKQSTSFMFTPGKDKRLDVDMPWLLGNNRETRCKQCLRPWGYTKCDAWKDCEAAAVAKLGTNKAAYKVLVMQQVDEEMEPPLRAFCESLGRVWSTAGGCAQWTR